MITKIARKDFLGLAEIVMTGFTKVARVYSQDLYLKATKRKGSRQEGKRPHIEILFTIGTPDYRTKKLIKGKDKFPLTIYKM